MTDLFRRWLEPQDWKRDGDQDPVIGLGAAGCFDDMHLFAPCGLWEKSEHNPVFGPDPSRAWESHDTTSQTIQQLPDGGWRMWYASRPAPPFQHKYFAIGTTSWEGPRA